MKRGRLLQVFFVIALFFIHRQFGYGQNVLEVNQDGRITNLTGLTINENTVCKWQSDSAAELPAKTEILNKLQNTLKIFQDEKNVNYVFLKRMDKVMTQKYKNDLMGLTRWLRTNTSFSPSSKYLSLVKDLSEANKYRLSQYFTNDTLQVVFVNPYRKLLRESYETFITSQGLNEEEVQTVLNLAHKKLELIKGYLGKKVIEETDVKKIETVLRTHVELNDDIKKWILMWLWVYEGTPTINPAYSSDLKKDSILKAYFFSSPNIIVNKLYLPKGKQSLDFYAKTTKQEMVTYKRMEEESILIYNTPIQNRNVVRISKDTLPVMSDFQQTIAQVGLNFSSIAGVIGSKVGGMLDEIFRIQNLKEDERKTNADQFNDVTTKSNQSSEFRLDTKNLKNQLIEDSIYLTELIRILNEPLPYIYQKTNIDNRPSFYTSRVVQPTVESPGRHTILIKSISPNDSIILSKTVVKYKKKVSFDVSIGLAYTVPDHVYYEFVEGQNRPKSIYQQHVRLITGIHWYPWKIDMSSNEFKSLNKERFSLFGGVGVPNPLNNLYLGLSYDVVPGFKITTGCHWTRFNKIEIVNDQIKIDDQYRLKMLFPYFGIQISPVSAITPLLSALGL